jgi:ATP-dependent RNA helicase RhlE
VRVLVATDIAARGIDVEALSHVVNFDVPNVPEDYIHRVGRTARAEATGDAFTFVAPNETEDLARIERAIGKRLPRITVPGFDYVRKPAERLEVPLQERLAAMRAQRARGRSKTTAGASASPPPSPRDPHGSPSSSRPRNTRRFRPGR